MWAIVHAHCCLAGGAGVTGDGANAGRVGDALEVTSLMVMHACRIRIDTGSRLMCNTSPAQPARGDLRPLAGICAGRSVGWEVGTRGHGGEGVAVGSLKLSALLFASHALHVSARHEKGCAPLCGMRKVFLRNVRARPCYKVRLRRESLRGTRTALPARSVPAGPSARLHAKECARAAPHPSAAPWPLGSRVQAASEKTYPASWKGPSRDGGAPRPKVHECREK